MIPHRPIQIPQMCANCGKSEAKHVWNLTLKHRSQKRVFHGVIVTAVVAQTIASESRRSSINFTVSVCDACNPILKRRQSDWRLFRNIAVVLFSVGLVGLGGGCVLMYSGRTPKILNTRVFQNIDLGFVLLGVCALATLLGIVMLWLMSSASEALNIVTFNGASLTFKNKAYHQAFASLNPEIAKRFQKIVKSAF